MEVRESCYRFFEDSFGYIGCSEQMPERSCIERICAIFALAILSVASCGVFLAYETYRFCSIKVLSKYVVANEALKNTYRHNPYEFDHYSYYIKLLCDTLTSSRLNNKTVVPRLDFFETFQPNSEKDKEDRKWLVFLILLFGIGTIGRVTADQQYWDFGIAQLMASIRFLNSLPLSDFKSIMSEITTHLSDSSRNNGIIDPPLNMYHTLEQIPQNMRDEAFTKFVMQLHANLPRRNYNQLIPKQ